MRNKKEEKLDKQYQLGLKEPWTNRIWKVKGSLSKRFVKYEKENYFKQTFVWIAIFTAILLNALIINYFNKIEPQLPSQIPLLNNYIDLESRLIDSIQLAYLPTVAIVITLILVTLSNRIYKRKPYFSYLILSTLTFTLLGFLINLISLSNHYI